MFVCRSLRPAASCGLASAKAIGSVAAKLITAGSKAVDAGMRWITTKSKDEANDSQHDDTDEVEADPLQDFRLVVANLDIAAVEEYASSIRRSRASSQQYDVTPWSFECEAIMPPLHGSFNILYPLLFGDGEKWLFRVPAAGHAEAWDDMAARSLTTEALTMRSLRKNGLPIPEVYTFQATLEHPLRCPYILMEHLAGERLYDSKSSHTTLSSLW